MEWSNDDCLQLIDLYEQYPVLWEAKHPFHFSKHKKTDAWNEIAEKIVRDVNSVKQKMTSLLGSFRAQKSKGKKTVGTGKGRHEVYISKWFAFARMHFLLDKDEANDTIDTINDVFDSLQEPVPSPAETLVSVETETLTDIQSESRGADSQESTATTSSYIENQRVITPKLKKQRILKEKNEDPRVKEAFLILKDTHAKYSASNQREIETPADRFHVYGQHVAHKLRLYSQQTQAIVEHNINNILFEADMGRYEHIMYSFPQTGSCPSSVSSTPTPPGQLSYSSSASHQRSSSIPTSASIHFQHTTSLPYPSPNTLPSNQPELPNYESPSYCSFATTE